MSAILPPPQTLQERRILRRVKAYRCRKWFIVFSVFALTAFIARAQLLGLAAIGLAAVAAIGAVVYRLIEDPQEVTLRDHSHARKEPPVIHVNRKG